MNRLSIPMWISIVLYIALFSLLAYGLFQEMTASRLPIQDEDRDMLQEYRDIPVAGDHAFPPLSFVDHRGQFSGYEADLFKALETVLEISFDYKQQDWQKALLDLQEGKIVAITGMRITEDRQELYHFTDPYWETGYAIIVPEGESKEEVLNREELTVLVQESSATHDYFTSHYHREGIEYSLFHRPVEALQALLRGEGDLWFESIQVARYESLTAGLLESFTFHFLPESHGAYAMALGPEYGHLLPLFNSALEQLLDDGVLSSLDKKWFGMVFDRQEDIDWRAGLLILGLLVLTLFFFFVLWTCTMQKKVAEATNSQKILLENIPVHIWYQKRDGTYGLVNRAHAEFFGSTPEKMHGKTLQEIHPNQEVARCLQDKTQVVFQEGVTQYFDETFVDTYHKERVFRIVQTAKLNNRGKVEYVISSGVDVTAQKLGEEALAHEKEQLQVTLYSIGDGVITTDTEGRVHLINRAAQERTGWDQKSAWGQPLEQIFPLFCEHTREKVENPVGKVIEHDSMLDLQEHFLLMTRDGETIPVAYSASPMHGREGEIIGVALVFRDVTQEREAQKQLEETNRRLDSLIEASPLAIIAYDTEGRVIIWNEAAEEMFEYRAEEVLGQFTPLVKKENLEGFKKYFTKVLQGEPFLHKEGIRYKKSGTPIYINFSMAPIMDSGGNTVGAMSVCSDVTERNKAIEALKKNEEWYRVTFENTGTGMIVIEEDTTISLANRQIEEVTGYTMEDIVGQSWTQFVYAEDLERMVQYHKQRRVSEVDGKAPNQYEFRLKTKDGNTRHMLFTIRMVPNTTQSIGSLIDVSDQKKIEYDLRENKNKIQRLHELALNMSRSQKEEDIFQAIIHAAEGILNYQQ